MKVLWKIGWLVCCFLMGSEVPDFEIPPIRGRTRCWYLNTDHGQVDQQEPSSRHLNNEARLIIRIRSFTDHRNISDERHLKGDHLLDMKTSSEKWGIWYSLYIAAVVGGFNPSEKYSSNQKSSLNRGENKKYMSNHHPNSVQTLQKNTTKFWNHPMMCFDRNLRGLAPNPSLPPASAKKHQEKWKTSNPEIGFKIPTFKHFRPDIPWSPKSCNVHGASKQRIWRVLRGWIRHGETKLDGYSLWNGQLVGGFSPTDLKNMTKSNCIISPQNGLKINKKYFNPPSQDCFFLFLSN